MNKKLLGIILMIIGLTFCALYAQGSTETATTTDPGTLSVYTAFLENEAIEIFDAFQKETGVKVSYVRMGAGSVLTRLRAESKNPQVSVWFGGSSDTFNAAANDGLLEKYVPKDIGVVAPEYTDPNGMWTPATFGAIGFATNDNWRKEKGIDVPSSWADLLTAAYIDNISTAHPATSGTAYTLIATVVQLMGEDEAFAYLTKMNKNVQYYTKSGGAPVRMAGLGETGMAFAFSQDIQQAMSQDYPITMSFPSEGTGYEVSAMAIIKGGPAKEAANAKLFIDWALREKAQGMFAEFFRMPVNRNVSLPAGSPGLDDITVIRYDDVWAGENRDRLIDKFEELIRDKDNLK